MLKVGRACAAVGEREEQHGTIVAIPVFSQLYSAQRDGAVIDHAAAERVRRLRLAREQFQIDFGAKLKQISIGHSGKVVFRPRYYGAEQRNRKQYGSNTFHGIIPLSFSPHSSQAFS